MTFGQVLSALRARWRVALAVLLVIGVATLAASLVWPKKYAASASVVVDIKPDPVSALLYPGLGSPQFMATQVDVINSDRVARRVVRNLKLAENPQWRAQWQEATDGKGDMVGWLADLFQRSMEVKPSRESNVITVTYKAPDPRVAAGLANAFVQAYIDTTLEMRVNPAKEYSSFFDTRLKDARDALEKAQAKLSAFQQENGIIATDERLDVESARLNELSSQVVVLQALTAESLSRQAQAQGTSGDRLQDVLTNPVIASLKTDLARSEVSLEQLSARLGDNHPQVIEAKANVAEQRRRLDAETKRVLGGVSVSNTVNQSREAQVRKELEAQRAKVLKMKAVRDEGQVLARDVENAQRAYDAVQGRLSQSSLESQTQQSNVYPLSEAVVPVDPASPRVGLNMLVAVFVGTMLAVATALLLEFIDRRVRDPHDLGATLGLPVLAVLPDAKKGQQAATRRGLIVQQRVVGSLRGPASEKA